MTWVIDALGRIKVTPGVHDHSSAIAGGDDLNPETISTRMYIVGQGCPYTTLGAAIAACVTPCVILITGITTTEAGAVTIPANCHVICMEEGSTIGMGVNTLHVSDNAGLYNVRITSTAQISLQINNASPVLRNVYIRNTKAGAPVATLFYVIGTSSPRLYDCIAETTTNFTQLGFGLGGSGSPELYRCQVIRTGGTTSAPFFIGEANTTLLEHCIADDATNFTIALYIDNVAAVVTTRHCTFRGNTDDVSVGAAATWNSYKDQVDPLNCSISGTADMLDANAGNSFAFKIKNTSGGAALAGAVGYIDEAGEYKTTATAYLDAAWCVVVIGGPNNGVIWVARRGRVTVTLNGNCNVGDKLYTSTTAGQAQPQTYMRPEMFAVALTANAAGAGGTCVALLYCGTRPVSQTSAIDVFAVAASSDFDWRTTINGAPVGAVVTYTVPLTSGAEDTIVPTAANLYGKLRLYNETRADYALIDSVNIGANTITLTAAAPGAWANADVITVRSQTCVYPAPPPYFYDIDLSSADNVLIPPLVRALLLDVTFLDTGPVGPYMFLHPWEAFGASKAQAVSTQVANQQFVRKIRMPLYRERFCFWINASGAGTASMWARVVGWDVAVP